MRRFHTLACMFATTLCMLATLPASADSDMDKLNDALFRAGEKADITRAKAIVDHYRKDEGNDLPAGYLDTVDACYNAGAPDITVTERENILRDGDITKFYAPNDNMRFAEGFANAWGVKKDPKRAIAFACRANTVPQQLIAQIQELTSGKYTPFTPFLFCNHVTNDTDNANCVASINAQEEKRRSLWLYRLSEDYSDPVRKAYGQLSYAASVYFENHAKYETGGTGASRQLAYLRLKEAKQKDFFYQVQAMRVGQFPPSRKGGYNPVPLDATLNARYHQIMKSVWPDPADHPGAVTKEGLLRTERAWVAYKAAWLNFAHSRIGAGSDNALIATLTEERIQDLKDSYDKN